MWLTLHLPPCKRQAVASDIEGFLAYLLDGDSRLVIPQISNDTRTDARRQYALKAGMPRCAAIPPCPATDCNDLCETGAVEALIDVISLSAEPAAFNAAARALGILAKGGAHVRDEIGQLGVIKLLVQSAKGADKEVRASSYMRDRGSLLLLSGAARQK